MGIIIKKSSLLGAVCAIFIFFSVPMSASATTVVIQPGAFNGKDAQISDGVTTADNYGTNADLVINWSGNLRSVGLIEYDLSSIPNNVNIASATLSLFHRTNSGFNSQYDVFRVTSTWDESTVTFNTAPTIDPVAAASLTITDSLQGMFRDWDVTSLVSGWVDGSSNNFGMWIEEIPVQGNAAVYFSSSDDISARRPILTIEFSPVPIPAAVWLFGSGLLGLVGMARRKKA